MLRSLILLVVALGAWSPVLGRDRETLPVSRVEAFTPGHAEHERSQRAPEGLSSADWSGIREAWDAGRHAAFPVDGGAGGWRARNPGQGWLTSFDGRGFTVRPDAAGWEWGLELLCYGFAGEERTVSEPARTSAQGQRVAYEWDETLEEWYVNDTRGLEHGFTVRERPKGSANEREPLCITLALRGDQQAEIDGDGRGARFRSDEGAPALTYAGLTAFDADGTRLDVRMESVAQGLRIVVDERGARYPLTIDPIAQQAYLKASNTGAGDFFGWSVAVSGATVVVGSPREDSSATGVDGDQGNNGASDAGAAYVFVLGPAGWSQQAYLKASNAGAGDQFGWSVSISGDTAVVCAQLEDSGATGVNGNEADNSAPDSGAAYVFERSGTSWSQQAYLKASNTGIQDQLGSSVSVSGDTLVVGASAEDSNATGVNGNQENNDASLAGAAYVFVRSGTSWSQQAYLKAYNTGGGGGIVAGDQFGASVSLSGDTLVIGSPEEDSNATGLNGNGGDDSAPNSGAAYVFVRSGTSWSQQGYLKASNTGALDSFGLSVAVSGDRLVIGAPGEASNATGVDGDQSNNIFPNSGAAYVFVRDATIWSQQAYLKASNTGIFDSFGRSVSASPGTIVVGAHFEASSATGVNGDESDNSAALAGAAYVFVRNGTSWSQEGYLKASNPAGSDYFGVSVSMSDGTVVVGALGEASNASGVNGDQENDDALFSGAAYAFQICSPAIVVLRNAGSNPASYVASPAVIGTTFTATVDNDLAGQTTSLLFAFDTATSFPLGSGQTLLCVDSGNGELFTGGNLYPTASASGVDSYSLAIPNNPALAELVAYSQAMQFGNPPFVLSNAQDLTIGAF